MSSSDSHGYVDEADLAEQQTPVGDDESVDVHGRDDVDEGDLLEQAIPVPDDEDVDRG